jgi:hypothetical protein
MLFHPNTCIVMACAARIESLDTKRTHYADMPTLAAVTKLVQNSVIEWAHRHFAQHGV